MTEILRKRRWFQFRLRTVFLVLTAACVWLGLQIDAAHRQKKAVARIVQVGGTVAYDYEIVPGPLGVPGGDIDKTLEPLAPSWLRGLMGEDLFRSAAVSGFDGKTITNFDLEQLGKLPQLISVGLSNVKIADSAISSEREFGDCDLAALGGLAHLQLVGISRTEIDGSGIGYLAGSKEHLTALFLSSNPISDAGSEQIGKLTRLVWLDLSDTSISDSGLVHFQNLTHLEQISLRNTHVSDAGLQHLKGLKGLAGVNLSGTNVTKDGIRDLQRALPKATITGP